MEIPVANEVAGWLGPLVVDGILVWFLWNQVTKVTPALASKAADVALALAEKNAAVALALAEKNTELVKMLVMDSRDDRDKAHLAFQASLAVVVEHCTRDNNRLIVAMEKVHAGLAAAIAGRPGGS